MFYLAIDQHRKQLTVNNRNEEGDVVLKRQVSTEWKRVREFFADLRQRTAADGGFMAIVEVCSFNDWLLKMLDEYGCREIVLVQPEKRSNKKTDRRDANTLGEILWVNRARWRAGKKVRGLRRVFLPSQQNTEDRQVTALRQRLGQSRTRTINQIKHILRKHNLEQECPTKGLATIKGRHWLTSLNLGPIDRLAMDQLLTQWKLWDEQINQVEKEIQKRCRKNQTTPILMTIPGCQAYAALALASRIEPADRFPRRGSLANYWGLTPRCNNSGDVKDRLGSITKQGSAVARFILGQIILHVLRRDPSIRNWYGKIKRRRGSKIARVAVMRHLTTIIQQMVQRREAYRIGGAAALPPAKAMDGKPQASRKRQGDVDFRRHGKVSTGKQTAPCGKHPHGADAPVAHLDPAIPPQVASPQSLSPLGRADTL